MLASGVALHGGESLGDDAQTGEPDHSRVEELEPLGAFSQASARSVKPLAGPELLEPTAPECTSGSSKAHAAILERDADLGPDSAAPSQAVPQRHRIGAGVTLAHTPSSPLASIISSSFNYERYLAQTIDSALSQTWPSVELRQRTLTCGRLWVPLAAHQRQRVVATRARPHPADAGAERRTCPDLYVAALAPAVRADRV